MNSMVAFDLEIQGLDEGGREDIQVVRIANVLLCKEITKSWLWPMKLPGTAICWKARKALVKEYKTDVENDLSEVRKQKKADAEAAAAAAALAAAPAATHPAAGAADLSAALPQLGVSAGWRKQVLSRVASPFSATA
eukprot:scaffold44388_cov63-Phaeocystis_antarctica.AAC.5